MIKIRNFWRKFSDAVNAPVAFLIAGAVWYLIYHFWGPEAGLMPPGYVTGIFFGACIFFIAGFMATKAMQWNFPIDFEILFDLDDYEFVDDQRRTIATCRFFAFYALSLWALTSML